MANEPSRFNLAKAVLEAGKVGAPISYDPSDLKEYQPAVRLMQGLSGDEFDARLLDLRDRDIVPYNLYNAVMGTGDSRPSPPKADPGPTEEEFDNAGEESIWLSDRGNAQRLVAQHGENIRYCHKWHRWLVWNGKTWDIDEDGAIQRLARETVKEIYVEALTAKNRSKTAKWAISSESGAHMREMVRMAQDEEGVGVKTLDLDGDPMLLSVRNGTLDLSTCTLREHRREDLITKLVDADCGPGAESPNWTAFLERVVPDPELRTFLARAAGLALTGITEERCLFFLYGGGTNGKSTFVEALMNLLGDYAQKAPASLMMVKRGDGVPNDVARLVGKRLVVASEIEQGKRMAEALVKDLTGNDTLTARFMRAEWFDFEPSHKIWIYGNHKPEIRGTDDAIWNRIRLIPFEVQIPDDEIDTGLGEKLRGEAAGVLAWALEGLKDYRENGLGVPSAVLNATGSYRIEQDEIARFISERCYRDPQARCGFGQLFAIYTLWGGGMRSRQFGTEVRAHGYQTTSGTGNVTQWVGLGLLHES